MLCGDGQCVIKLCCDVYVAMIDDDDDDDDVGDGS